MGYAVVRSNSTEPLRFLIVLSSDHITGATGKTPTVTIAKNTGLFSAPAGAVSEVGSGWYQIAPNALDANTLGPLLLHAEASGCDPTDDQYDVVSYNPNSFQPTTIGTGGTYTGASIVNGAARELGVLGQGSALSANNAAIFLDVLARIVDDWNAQREAVFSTEFLSFTFTPNLNPHTIGPTGTWTVSQRPEKLEGATVVLSTGPSGVNAPSIYLHDQSVGIPTWFQSLSTPNLATSYPTEGYYDATWPNGSLYLWPVPGTAYDCQIQVRSILTNYAMTTTFSMPPGYRSALTLTLAEQTADIFGRLMPATLPDRALRARARIFSNNTGGNRVATWDTGIPVAPRRGKRSNYNWLTGMTNGRFR